MLNAEVRRAPTLVHNSLAHHVPTFFSRPLVLIYEWIASAICIHFRLALPMHGPPVSFRTYTAAPLALVLLATAAAVSRTALPNTPFFASSSPSPCGVGYTRCCSTLPRRRFVVAELSGRLERFCALSPRAQEPAWRRCWLRGKGRQPAAPWPTLSSRRRRRWWPPRPAKAAR